MKHEVYLEYLPIPSLLRPDGSVIPLNVNDLTIQAVTCSCGKRMPVMPDITRAQAIALGTLHIEAANALEMLCDRVVDYLGVFMPEQDAKDYVLLYHDLVVPFVQRLNDGYPAMATLGAFRVIAQEIGLTSFTYEGPPATLDHEEETDQEETNGT